MILLTALALAVAWALLRGGRPSHLQSLSLQGVTQVLIAFALQAGVIYLPVANSLGHPARVGLLIASYALALWFIWANRKLPGMWLMGLGLLANWLVIVANGGYMPVTFEALEQASMTRLVNSTAPGTLVMGSKDVLLPLAETRLSFLSDIFVLPPPFPVTGVFSVGDVLIAMGIFRFVPFALGGHRNAPTNPRPAL